MICFRRRLKIDLEILGKIAKVLDVDPYDLIDFNDNTVNNIDQKGGNAANIGSAVTINFHLFSKEIKSLYEKLIEEKHERIKWLENKIGKS